MERDLSQQAPQGKGGITAMNHIDDTRACDQLESKERRDEEGIAQQRRPFGLTSSDRGMENLANFL